MVFLAGQVGWNAEHRFESGDFVAQARQALANIATLVAEAGGRAEHITRLTWFVLDKREYLSRLRELGEAYRGVMGKHFPAMTLVQVGALLEEGQKSRSRVPLSCRSEASAFCQGRSRSRNESSLIRR